MSTPSSLAIVFWSLFATVAFAYLGYPLLILLLSRLFGRRHTAPAVDDEAHLPVVSLLIAAHNEEVDIDARILNALALDYPAGKLEIAIASDGRPSATDRSRWGSRGRFRMISVSSLRRICDGQYPKEP